MREVKMKFSFMALTMCLSIATQIESFETRAISTAQRIPASSLDSKLPNRSFGDWFSELVGQDSGVVWQLAECGAVGPTDGNGRDVPACAEATVLLPNGDKVIVGISVGTFKKGLVGDPTFVGAVVDSGDRLYQVRKLSDLPGTLRLIGGSLTRGAITVRRSSDSPGASRSSKRVLSLPDLNTDSLQVVMLPSTNYPPSLGDNSSSPKIEAIDDDAPPPPPLQRNSGELVGANIISSVKPVYPRVARSMGVSGKVDVRVVISETGRVVEATALSGPMTLQGAAVAAARQWLYKPATLNGAPVKTESVLTFTFDPREQ
jgi:TonB family protein